MEAEDGGEVERKLVGKTKTCVGDPENEESEEIPYPKSTFFISSNEFCERFCYYGLRTILSLYLTEYLLYSENDATIIYHTFIMLAYFFPIFGAILADSYFGKFNTTFYVSMVYALGCIILSLSSVTPLNLPHRTFALLGLFGIALGTGGIKPCIITLGADQFIMPQQEKSLSSFYGIFYVCINLGSLLSTTITPMLRKNVQCFGEETCYPLAFGISAVLMIGAIVTIGIGKSYFRLAPPEESLIVKVVKCIASAIKGKCSSKKKDKVDHWLDHASKSFDVKLIGDLKQTLKMLLLFVPFPLAWTLIDQTGSGWTFQARRMYSDLGFYNIPADQMQILLPLFYMLLIPVFQYSIYPIFDKIGIFATLLQKVALGGFLISFSFVCSACVSLALESTYPALPSQGVGHIRIYNTLPCNTIISCPGLNSTTFEIVPGGYYENAYLELNGNKSLLYSLSSNCGNTSGSFSVYEDTSVGYYFQNLQDRMFLDDLSKPAASYVRIRALVNTRNDFVKVAFTNSGGTTVINSNSSDSSSYDINFGTYHIMIGNSEFETKFLAGGVYAILATVSTDGNSHFNIASVEVTTPNSVHILWLIPQYFLIAAGELLFNMPAAEFAYTQSPVSMKSIVMACWLLTTAFGNLLVVLISAASFFDLASNNFFMYAVLMFLDMVIFYFMTRRYKYVETEKS